MNAMPIRTGTVIVDGHENCSHQRSRADKVNFLSSMYETMIAQLVERLCNLLYRVTLETFYSYMKTPNPWHSQPRYLWFLHQQCRTHCAAQRSQIEGSHWSSGHLNSQIWMDERAREHHYLGTQTHSQTAINWLQLQQLRTPNLAPSNPVEIQVQPHVQVVKPQIWMMEHALSITFQEPV